MNITPATLYWIMKLDDIKSTFSDEMAFITTMGVLALVVLTIARSVNVADGNTGSVKTIDSVRRYLWWPIPLLIVEILVSLFLPTTKQAAVILTVPAMLNSEFVSETLPKEGKELYDLAKGWLKEQTYQPEKERKSE